MADNRWAWQPDVMGDWRFVRNIRCIVVERFDHDERYWRQVGTIATRALTFAGQVRACRRYMRDNGVQLRLPNIIEEE